MTHLSDATSCINGLDGVNAADHDMSPNNHWFVYVALQNRNAL